MDLPDSDSWESTPMAEALVQNINPGINPILVEAVQNPEYRSKVLIMENFIQRFVQTDFQHVKFPSLSNPYLRAILSLLALHYGIRSVSIEGTRLIGKRIPFTRIPSDTLSSIPSLQPKDEMSDNFKFIETSTNLKRQTGGTPSSNLNLNQTCPRHNRVAERTSIIDASNFQDQPVAYPTSIPQSQLMQLGASVSQPALPPHGASASPYVAGNFLSNPSTSFMQLMQGHISPSQETLEWTSINIDASKFQDQPVAYPTRIPQSQLMQPAANVSQPALPSHGASASPYVAGNLLSNPSASYMQLTQGSISPSQETLQYQPSGKDNELLKPAANVLQTSQASTQPPSQEPLQYKQTGTYSGFLQDVLTSSLQPSRPPADPNGTSVLPSTYNQLPTLQYGSSIAGPSGPLLDHYGQSDLPSTLAPQFPSYNPVNSTYMQFSMPQSRQPFSLEQMLQPRPAQPPSTCVAFQNQDIVNVPHQMEEDGTGRSERLTDADAGHRSLQKLFANIGEHKTEHGVRYFFRED